MHSRIRTAATLLAGGVLGASVALPLATGATPGPTHGQQPATVRPAAEVTADQHRHDPADTMSRQQMAQTMNQCRQVMQTPQMRKAHRQMMGGGQMMGGSNGSATSS